MDYLLKSSFYGFVLKPNFSAPLCLSSCISFKTKFFLLKSFLNNQVFLHFKYSSKCTLTQGNNITGLSLSVSVERSKLVRNVNCLIRSRILENRLPIKTPQECETALIKCLKVFKSLKSLFCTGTETGKICLGNNNL